MFPLKELKVGNILLRNNICMAPMAGYTCYPFRMLCYELGAGVCFTEMVSCNALKYNDKANQRLLFTTEKEPLKAAQILGGKPALAGMMSVSEALSEFDIIDINMGCPVPNVFKSGEGSALMTDLKRASNMIKSVKKSGKVVTVKCRTGIQEDKMITAEFAKMCEDAGADMITIHGRSRSMMYYGEPHYEQIEQAKSVVSIPVIANGGIYSVEQADKVMKRTDADGVMIARFALEDPFIFSKLAGKEIKKDKYTILLEQMELTLKHYDETFAITYIRTLISFFMKKKSGTKQYKPLLFRAGSVKELEYLIEKIFRT